MIGGWARWASASKSPWREESGAPYKQEGPAQPRPPVSTPCCAGHRLQAGEAKNTYGTGLFLLLVSGGLDAPSQLVNTVEIGKRPDRPKFLITGGHEPQIVNLCCHAPMATSLHSDLSRMAPKGGGEGGAVALAW